VDQPFNPDHKALVGYIISNLVQQAASEYNQNLKSLKSINDNTKMIIRNYESNTRKFDKLRESYGESLLALCRDYLSELSEYHKRNFILSSDAIDKIRNFTGNIALLKLILEDAAAYVTHIYFEEDDIDIEIHGWELNFDKFTVTETSSQDLRKIDNKESKAMQLLDKLEKAAEEVIRNKQPLTSANVGKHCPTPISAPAISDALKKNRKRVVSLLEKYPEKWVLIRHQFRPIKNVQQNQRADTSFSSG
jgi:hypothetical protein